MLASAVSLASIVAPLVSASLHVRIQDRWPGAIWPSAVAVQAGGAAIVRRLRFGEAPPTPA